MTYKRLTNLSNVAILAGGFGTRLNMKCGNLPKPMVPLLHKPTLLYQIELCHRYGFKNIRLLVHHQHEAITTFFGDGSNFGVNITYSIESKSRGTAGALLDAISLLDERFLVLYGDTYLDINLRKFWNAHNISGADATLFLHPNDHPQDSDVIQIDENGRVTSIYSYPHNEDFEARNLVNAGLYVLEKSSLINYESDLEKEDIAKHLFPSLLDIGSYINGYISPEYIKDMGTPERLEKVEQDIASGLPERLSGRGLRTAVFLDRDGTINSEVNYLTSPDQLELIDGVAKGIKRLNRSGTLAVVVTNQPVIARGEITMKELNKIHGKLETQLGLNGAYLDRIYVCPHHPDKGYVDEIPELKMECSCRKPNIGMIEDACGELLINPRESWMVGDTTSDIEAGRRAGLRTILLRTGYAGSDFKYSVKPDYVCPNLYDAVDWILDGHKHLKDKLMPVMSMVTPSTRMILIGGLARSGKSFAAQMIKEISGNSNRTTHVISLDGWLLPRTLRKVGVVNGVLRRYNLSQAAKILEPLINAVSSQDLDEPLYDRAVGNSKKSNVTHHIAPEDLIIVEGVPALLISELTSHHGVMKIYIDIDSEIRNKRLTCDYQWRPELSTTFNEMLAARESDELPIILDSQKFADFIINNRYVK
jgi:histidinol-phosphate phosphatase family protein